MAIFITFYYIVYGRRTSVRIGIIFLPTDCTGPAELHTIIEKCTEIIAQSVNCTFPSEVEVLNQNTYEYALERLGSVFVNATLFDLDFFLRVGPSLTLDCCCLLSENLRAVLLKYRFGIFSNLPVSLIYSTSLFFNKFFLSKLMLKKSLNIFISAVT